MPHWRAQVLPCLTQNTATLGAVDNRGGMIRSIWSEPMALKLPKNEQHRSVHRIPTHTQGGYQTPVEIVHVAARSDRRSDILALLQCAQGLGGGPMRLTYESTVCHGCSRRHRRPFSLWITKGGSRRKRLLYCLVGGWSKQQFQSSYF